MVKMKQLANVITLIHLTQTELEACSYKYVSLASYSMCCIHNKAGLQCWNERTEEQEVTEVWYSIRGHKCSGSPVQITQQEDPVHQRRGGWGLDGAGAPLQPKEKALVPGRLMRAGLLKEGAPLEEYAIVCGSSTPQRSHFLWLMSFKGPCNACHCSVCAQFIRSGQQSSSCMCCRMQPCGTHMFLLLSLWEYEYVSAENLEFVFHVALCVFFIFASGC